MHITRIDLKFYSSFSVVEVDNTFIGVQTEIWKTIHNGKINILSEDNWKEYAVFDKQIKRK